MKKYLFGLIIFLFVQNISLAQSTWVKTPSVAFWLPYSLTYDTTHIGPTEITVTPNGTIISLVQIDMDHQTNLIAMDSTGNILWSRLVGTYYASQSDDCYSLHATKNNGCIFILLHDTWGVSENFTIYNIDSSGQNLSQLQYYFPLNGLTYLPSVNITNTNSLLVQFSDSIVVYDSIGTEILSRSPFSGSIKMLTDTDFILSDSSKIIRENFNGNSSWSLITTGYTASSANLSCIYASNGDSVMKINTSNGFIFWTKPIHSYHISPTSDDGFIIINGMNANYANEITKYDSSGNQEWTKNYPFPSFGYRAIAETKSRHYVTGGSWRNKYLVQPSRPVFSPFLAQIDSNGKGVLDSTDFFFVGNANNNYHLSFGDDGVYVAAAIGNSGLPRDLLLRDVDNMNAFATQWADSFNAGINYRFSDYDGNGIVNTADVRKFAQTNIYTPNNITPDYLKTSSQQSSPMLSFLFENDTINYTDTIKVDIILGSPSIPIDSIYGLSFDLGIADMHSNTGQGINSFYSIKPSALGDTSVNLYVYFLNHNQSLPYVSSMVLCRTDHLNAYVAGDTIATLFFVAPSNSTIANPVFLYFNWNAITVGGYQVPLNLVSDSLILTGITGINNPEQNEIKIFPNPANDRLFLSFENHILNEITIMDETGRIIYSIENPGNKFILNTKQYPDGVYYISAVSENKISRTKFLVVH